MKKWKKNQRKKTNCMKNYISAVLLLLATNAFGQTFHLFTMEGDKPKFVIGASTGYSQLIKKNDIYPSTSSIGGIKTLVSISESSSTTSTTTKTRKTGQSESVPFALNFGVVTKKFEVGAEYQSFLQKPIFYTPIRATSKVAISETFSFHSAGIYFRGKFGKEFQPFFELSAGKRWNFDKLKYSNDYKAINPDVQDQNVSLKSTFYVGTTIGVSAMLFEHLAIELKGRYFPVEYYEELDSIERTKITHWQGNIGLRYYFGGNDCDCVLFY